MSKHYKTVETIKEVLVSVCCGVCKKKYSAETMEGGQLEIQEFIFIEMRGGYGSVFGDDCTIKLDICQHCLSEKLGEYIQVDCEW